MRKVYVSDTELRLDDGSDMGELLPASDATRALARQGICTNHLRHLTGAALGEEVMLVQIRSAALAQPEPPADG